MAFLLFYQCVPYLWNYPYIIWEPPWKYRICWFAHKSLLLTSQNPEQTNKKKHFFCLSSWVPPPSPPPPPNKNHIAPIPKLKIRLVLPLYSLVREEIMNMQLFPMCKTMTIHPTVIRTLITPNTMELFVNLWDKRFYPDCFPMSIHAFYNIMKLKVHHNEAYDYNINNKSYSHIKL